MKHRAAFIGTWLAIVIALVAFPGFETRGLAMGLIIGWWPFALLSATIGNSPLLNQIFILYLVMFLLSGAMVGACAWTMDAARLSKKIWVALPVSLATGAIAVFVLYSPSFEEWLLSPAVSAAMNSPELNYEPTRQDFYRSILIPQMLAVSLWGLYVAAASMFLYSVAVIRIRRLQNQAEPGARPNREGAAPSR